MLKMCSFRSSTNCIFPARCCFQFSGALENFTDTSTFTLITLFFCFIVQKKYLFVLMKSFCSFSVSAGTIYTSSFPSPASMCERENLGGAREPTIAQLLQDKALYSFTEWPKVLFILSTSSSSLVVQWNWD